MSKPSVLLRAILVIAPFFFIYQLPSIISIYNKIEIVKFVESSKYVRVIDESRDRTIAQDRLASNESPPLPAPQNSSPANAPPQPIWPALFLFPSILALLFHYVVSVSQWRGLNSTGRFALLLHFIGLGINVWPFLLHDRWLDKVIPLLIALIACPALALWAAILIETKGRSSRRPQPPSSDSTLDVEVISSAGTFESIIPSSPPAIDKPHKETGPLRHLPARIRTPKSGRTRLIYGLNSFGLYLVSYRIFNIHDVRECSIFARSSYSTRPLRDFIFGTIEGICDSGNARILAVFFFVLATIALAKLVFRRNSVSA